MAAVRNLGRSAAAMPARDGALFVPCRKFPAFRGALQSHILLQEDAEESQDRYLVVQAEMAVLRAVVPTDPFVALAFREVRSYPE